MRCDTLIQSFNKQGLEVWLSEGIGFVSSCCGKVVPTALFRYQVGNAILLLEVPA